MKAAVIGAGIGGIAIALRLKKMGYDVEVFEKNAKAGGKIAELKTEDYRFDLGPSLFTLPELVNELFDLFGESDRLEYEQLEIVCRYFWDDGTKVDSYSDEKKFAEELKNQLSEPEENTHRFLNYTTKLYDISADVFIFNSLHTLKTWINPNLFKNILNVRFLRPYTSMHKMLTKIFKQQKTIQLFDRYATYNGSNPYLAPSTLNVIAHLEHNRGAFFPKNGMYSIVEKLVTLAEKQKITFHYNSHVNKIIQADNKIRGINVENKQINFDIVVSDIDIFTLKTKLLDNKFKLDIKNKELSSSAIIFYWGVNNLFPYLQLHNILFSDNYKEEFDNLFNKNTIYHNPTVYIFNSSKVVSSDAKFGSENWFVMINTPPNDGQNWDVLVLEARKNIITKIKNTLSVDIEQYIDFEEIATPVTIEEKTASWRGALYGKNSNSTLSAFQRQANFSKKIKGLYFVGGSVHPGGGIPLAISSAKIAADFIKKDSKLR